ncbi:MAG: ankyrin repeat domain-containing protein [Acidobacteriota bacterium]
MPGSLPEDTPHPFVQPLPPRPSLDKQKKLAKRLFRDVCRGDGDALARVTALHPRPSAVDDFALHDAQLVVARGYGYSSWTTLKRKIESLTRSPVEHFVAAVREGDRETVDRLIRTDADVAAALDKPLFDFDQPAVHIARNDLPMLDLLLEHGADLHARSQWKYGGFGILDGVAPERAEALIARGAQLDPWSAAHLGQEGALVRLLDEDPTLVNAKGGDGKRPLHCAATPEIADLLLERGAEIDALDDDHTSTPAQYAVRSRPKVCRRLVAKGAKTDLLMAVALGDLDLVRRHLETDPEVVGMAVHPDWFPMHHTADNGGHIYQWELGVYKTAFEIARELGHTDVLAELERRAGPRDLLTDALRRGDTATGDALLDADPNLVADAGTDLQRAAADAARGNDAEAVAAMLERGFPVDAVSQHGATALHWAAFHGNPSMVRTVLQHGPPLEARDRDFDSTPLGWAIHGTRGSWPGVSTDDHGPCVELLLGAGADCPTEAFPVGDDRVDRILRAHLFGS